MLGYFFVQSFKSLNIFSVSEFDELNLAFLKSSNSAIPLLFKRISLSIFVQHSQWLSLYIPLSSHFEKKYFE